MGDAAHAAAQAQSTRRTSTDIPELVQDTENDWLPKQPEPEEPKEDEGHVTVTIPQSAPDQLPRGRWKAWLRDHLEIREVQVAINLFVIALVLVDVISTFIFAFGIPDEEEDCFGRDSIPQTCITAAVVFLFTLELGTRFLAFGLRETFKSKWNIFDSLVISASLGLALYQIINDYALVDAPGPPVISIANSPQVCSEFGASDNAGAAAARNAATSSRLVSRFAIGLRMARTFAKLWSSRRYLIYLEKASIWELCAADSSEDLHYRLVARPWEIGMPDVFGMYPIHIAAMNEHEDAPLMVEAILKTNRYAARHKDRFGSLALHYACRNRGPTHRQDTSLKLHTDMAPNCHRMLRHLLNRDYGFPEGVMDLDMDGMQPVDYVLLNPSHRKESALRALKMILHISPAAVTHTVRKPDFDVDLNSKLMLSKEPPEMRWTRLSTSFSHAVWRTSGTLLSGLPVGYGHDGKGRMKQEGGTYVVMSGHFRQADLSTVPCRNLLLRVFFRAFRLACRHQNRQETQVTSGILEQKKRALGHSAALIDELNRAVDGLLEEMLHQQTEHPATKHILNWFSVWEGMEGYRILRLALELEDESLTPSQKLYRVWQQECKHIFGGRVLYGRSFPHDALLALERRPLHLALQNKGPITLKLIEELLSGPRRYRIADATRVQDGMRRLPLHIAATNKGAMVQHLVSACLHHERLMSPRHPDARGRFALHYAALNPSPDAGEMVRRLAKLNASAARVEDSDGNLAMELAFTSTSPSVGMVMAAITTAYPDGATRDKDGKGSLLHRACSSDVVVKNPQAMAIVKALLAFHPQTARALDPERRVPLHRVAGTVAPQAYDIAALLIEHFPGGVFAEDKDSNTPMHLAALTANKAVVECMVQNSQHQAQHIQNTLGQYPSDVTKNLEIVNLLIDDGRPAVHLFQQTMLSLCSVAFIVLNAFVLLDYWNKHIALEEFGPVSPNDYERFFEWCEGCGIDSHLFYFVMSTIFYGASILVVLGLWCIKLFRKPPVQESDETGVAQKLSNVNAAIYNTSPLVLAKNIERFGIVFPVCLCHIVAVMQHEDKYWLQPGQQDDLTNPALHVVTIFFGFVMSAHTSVVLDISRMHTAQLKLSNFQALTLTDLEWNVLFFYRLGELSARIIIAAYAWFGLSACQYCLQEVCTCTFRWVAAPVVGFQFLVMLVLTSSYSFWLFLCNEAPKSFWSLRTVLFNFHVCQTVCNLMGCFFSQGNSSRGLTSQGDISGVHQSSLLPFLGDLRVFEALTLVGLHVVTNITVCYTASLTGIYGRSEADLADPGNNLRSMYATTSRMVFFCLANSGILVMIIAIGVRYRIWRRHTAMMKKRAKAQKIAEIVAKNPGVSKTAVENYNFTLFELQQMAQGRMLELLLTVRRAREKDASVAKKKPDIMEDEARMTEAELQSAEEKRQAEQKRLVSIKSMQVELGIPDYNPEHSAEVGRAALIAPIGLRTMAVHEETCTIRFNVPCPRGRDEHHYWDSISHCQVCVNGVTHMIRKLGLNKANHRLFQTEVKIDRGKNVLQVRVLMRGKHELWSGWSGDLIVDSVDEHVRREGRLQRYLDARHEEELSGKSDSGGSDHEMEEQWEQLLLDDTSPVASDQLDDYIPEMSEQALVPYGGEEADRNGTQTSPAAAEPLASPHVKFQVGEKTDTQRKTLASLASMRSSDRSGASRNSDREKRRMSVNKILFADEEKLLHAQIEESKGPSVQIQNHFKSATRQSGFMLVPLGGLAQHITEPIQLVLGFNLVLHDPRRGPASVGSRVDAFLRRVMVSGHDSERVEVFKAGGRGKFAATNNEKIELDAGDKLRFPDSGTAFVLRFKEPQLVPHSPLHDEEGGAEHDALELCLTLNERDKEYLPKTVVARAHFVRRFKVELAAALGISQGRVEVISMHRGDTSDTVDVTFLLLPTNPELEDLHDEHLTEPRLLASTLAELIATSSPLLREAVTIRNASSLTVKIAYHDGGEHPDHPELESSPSVSTISSAPAPAVYDAAARRSINSIPSGQARMSNGVSAAPGRSRACEIEGDITRPDAAKPSHDQSGAMVAPTAERSWQHDREMLGQAAQTEAGHHPLKTMEGRLGTFWQWGDRGLLGNERVSSLALARSGFYAIQDPDHPDCVRCAYCRLELASLSQRDKDPHTLHAQSSPACPMVLGEVAEPDGLELLPQNGPVPLSSAAASLPPAAFSRIQALREREARTRGPSNAVRQRYAAARAEASKGGKPLATSEIENGESGKEDKPSGENGTGTPRRRVRGERKERRARNGDAARRAGGPDVYQRSLAWLDERYGDAVLGSVGMQGGAATEHGDRFTTLAGERDAMLGRYGPVNSWEYRAPTGSGQAASKVNGNGRT